MCATESAVVGALAGEIDVRVADFSVALSDIAWTHYIVFVFVIFADLWKL